MKEKENLKESIKNKAPTQPKKVDKLITLTGITTSQINQALKADNPYPARVFLKVDNKEQDIPIFFRITTTYEGFIQKRKGQYINYSKCINAARYSKCRYGETLYCFDCQEKLDQEFKNCWIKPKIKTGSYLQVEGYFSTGTVYIKNSERKSFTATSYTLLACLHSQKKPYFCPIDCLCLKGKEVLNQQLNQTILDYGK